MRAAAVRRTRGFRQPLRPCRSPRRPLGSRRLLALVALGSILVCALSTRPAAPFGLRASSGRLVGGVRVCNTPTHCLTRTFEVVASGAGGSPVAQVLTSGVDNHYVLTVPPGRYTLVATSDGLRCSATATAVAGRTRQATITCLVP